MKAVIITSTNSIENAPVEKYIKPICSNIVLGVNIFSDIAASFSDFFGGTSSSYQRKLELIYKEATENLKQKAITLGANAILSFRVDFDEISGGGKSMFMVSASGTACIVDTTCFKSQKSSSKAGLITTDELRQEMHKRHIITSLEEKKAIKDDWFEFMMENPVKGYIKPLINIYITFHGNEHANEYRNRIINVLSRLEQREVADHLFEILKEQTKPILELISTLRLVNFDNVLKLCNNKDFQLVFELIALDAPYYNKESLEQLTQIHEILSSLPDTGRVEIAKGGLLNKEKEVFICQNGHKNDSDKEFCANCGFDIKGRTIYQKWNLDKLKEKIDALINLIS